MKKTIIALFVILTALAACSKKTTKTGGSWTFKNVTYLPTFVNYIRGAFTGYTQDNLPTGSLAFTFCDSSNTLPRPNYQILTQVQAPWGTIPHDGYYRVSNHNPPDSGYVYVALTDTSAIRTFCSVIDSNAIVFVTVNADKTITSVKVSGLLLKSDKNAADTGRLDATLTQINYK